MSIAVLVVSFAVWIFSAGLAFAQANSIIMGFSGAGISTDLRRVIEKENLWDKYAVSSHQLESERAGTLKVLDGLFSALGYQA